MRVLVERWPWLLSAVLAVELLAFMPALGQPGTLRAPPAKFSDLTELAYPWRMFWRDEVLSGRAPFWNPFTFAGAPAAGEPQLQTFYPPNVLWLWLQPEMAYELTLVLHVLLGSILMYALVRELGASPFGAAVSAMAFGLHGQMVIFSFAGWPFVIAPMAWAPGVLWALVRAFKPGRPGGRAIALGGVMLGIQFLSGHPEWVRFTLLCGALVVICHRPTAASLRRRVAAGAAILALGVLMGGPQLVPTVEAAARSSRGRAALAADTDLHGLGLPAITLPTVLVPRLFGPWDLDVSVDGLVHKALGRDPAMQSLVFIGVLPLGLAFVAAVRRTRSAAAWIAISAAGLLFALNDVTHLQCALDWLVPADAVFRYPARFVFMTNLALAVMAGLGASYIEAGGRVHRRVLAAGFGLAAAMGATALAMLALRQPLVDAIVDRVGSPSTLLARLPGAVTAEELTRWAIGQSAGQVATAAVIVAVSIAAVAWFMRAPGHGRALVVLGIIAIDLGLAGRPFLMSVVRVEDVYGADRQLVAPLADIPGARFFSEKEALTSSANVATLWRVRALTGYSAFLLPEFERLREAAETGHQGALRAMGVTHLMTGGSAGTTTIELPGARGRAWWTSRAETAPGADQAAAALVRSDDPDFVMFDGEPPASATARPAGGPDERAAEIDILVDVPGHLEARVIAPSEGWLVVTEVFYPGWRARVSGRDVQVRRAFGAMQAVALPAGASVVDLRYRPRTVVWGAAAGALGVVLALAMLFHARSRRSDPEAAPARALNTKGRIP